MAKYKMFMFICGMLLVHCIVNGQSYSLFADEYKQKYPSVVYDFLERYLYEIDSLVKKGESVSQRLKDDKVVFFEGDPSIASSLSPLTAFSIMATDDKYSQVIGTDSSDSVILNMAFPMQYELLLGKPKVQIEKEMKEYLKNFRDYVPLSVDAEELKMNADSIWVTMTTNHYYIESLNTSRYYKRMDTAGYVPIFDSSDRWHSAANLFHGVIDSVDGYRLYVEQNLYGYKKTHYTLPLSQWLAYCQAMKFDVYFAVEEEREDGLKALLITHSRDLNFNHVLSIIIPENFVCKSNTVFKVVLNAYIPTHNVKDLYQQYVTKPKKKI